jgi:hypothetical protein
MELVPTPSEEAARHMAEVEQHPERYRDDYWFEMTPTGEASMRRYEREHPNARRGKPPWLSEQQRQVKAYNESVTGRPYTPRWQQYMPQQQSADRQLAAPVADLRAEIRRLERRLAELENGRNPP